MRRGPFVLTRALVAAAVLLLPITAAHAHGHLLRSDPAKGSHVRALPSRLSLTFSEAPNVRLSHVLLVGASGVTVALGPLSLDEKDRATVTARIIAPLAAGHYTVRWQMAGDDGHPVRGEYGFDVDSGAVAPSPAGGGIAGPIPGTQDMPVGASPAPAAVAGGSSVNTRAGDAPAAVAHDAAVFDASSPVYALLRALQFAAVILLLGSLAFRSVVVPRFARSGPAFALAAVPMIARSAAVATWAAWAFLGVTLARLPAQHAAVFGVETAWSAQSLGALLWGSSWAAGWWLALTASVGAVAAARLARRANVTGWAWLAAALLPIVVSLGLSGHPAVAQGRVLSLIVDAVHVLGAGGWVGSLAVVLVAGIPVATALPEAQRHASVGALLNAFSPTALVAAGVLVLSGTIAGWRNVGSLGAIVDTPYGQVLLAKLAVLSITAATGAYNWKRVLPALGTEAATLRLTRSASVEIATAVVVIIITAVLVATRMPGEM